MSSDREVTEAEGAHTPSKLPASHHELEPAVSGSVFPTAPSPDLNPQEPGESCTALSMTPLGSVRWEPPARQLPSEQGGEKERKKEAAYFYMIIRLSN